MRSYHVQELVLSGLPVLFPLIFRNQMYEMNDIWFCK